MLYLYLVIMQRMASLNKHDILLSPEFGTPHFSFSANVRTGFLSQPCYVSCQYSGCTDRCCAQLFQTNYPFYHCNYLTDLSLNLSPKSSKKLIQMPSMAKLRTRVRSCIIYSQRPPIPANKIPAFNRKRIVLWSCLINNIEADRHFYKQSHV